MASSESKTFIELLDKLNTIQKKNVENTHDTYSGFWNHNDKTVYEPCTFEAYPESRTAQMYLQAYKRCMIAVFIIDKYKKENVENDEDCEYLMPAFQNYSRAHMCENHMFNMRSPGKKGRYLLDQYLKLRPNDVLAKYLHTLIIMLEPYMGKTDKRTDFKMLKDIIIAGEKFAFETERIEDLELKKEILTDHYYHLASVYSVTRQEFRAIDSFQKSFDKDESNYRALFGIACHYHDRDPGRAVTLLNKFIRMAPQCDKHYNEAYYVLATINLIHYKNLDEACRCADLGDEMYAKRLSFLPPNEMPQKALFDVIRRMRKRHV